MGCRVIHVVAIRRSQQNFDQASHSPITLGQLHKGGPDTGLFLQIVDDTQPDLPVPGTDYTFGRLIAAQADGDYRALTAKRRRLLRVHLDGDPVGGLAALEEAAQG